MSERHSLFLPHPEPYPERIEWRGWMVRAIDGDTIVVKLDLGFRSSREEAVRLKGYDSPEVVGVNKAAGLAARDFLNEVIPYGAPVLVTTEKMKQSFNRYVADVGYHENGEWKDLGHTMVEAGHAVWSEG